MRCELRTRRIRPRVLTLAAVCTLGVLGSVLLRVTPTSASDFGVNVIAQRGFGDPRNSYSWSMAWFRGKLYVGTARQELCVEGLTVDHYLPVADVYKTNPEPGVHCPRNPNNLSLRAEIWQYTPQTGRWRMVYISPVVRNPDDRHKWVARDLAYRGMVVYHDARGRPALYVGGVTPDEYLPGLKTTNPPRLLMTTDGVHFSVATARNVIVREPFGIYRPDGFRSMQIWRGKMFVTLSSGLTGDGSVFEVDRPWSRHVHFQRVSPALAVFEMQVFHNRLYIGTGDKTTGYAVYWSDGKGRVWHWHPAVRDGAGRGQVVTSVVSMAVYRGWLYVGSAGWYTANTLPVSELIRINPAGQWQVVAGNPRIYRGVLKAPISGLTDGFENIFAAHFWRMVNYRGGLYVGTNDWSWLLQEDTQQPWLQSLLSPEFGFDIWATCDGADWFPVTRNAFGNMDDFGARNLVGTPDGLFIGSANHAQGTTVWQDTDNVCSAFPDVHPAARVAATPSAPQQLLTDVQRKGTVLSWIPSADARRYVVYRTTYTASVPFSYDKPLGTEGGFLDDDASPLPVPAGAPGSQQTMLPIPGPSTPVGTTSQSYFVDRHAPRGARVLYQVAAEGSTGALSARSNVQVVPDPRPVATFGQLAAALGPGHAVFTADARARMQRGGRRAEMAVVDGLLRAAHLNPDAQALASRLQRRLEYADVAGGP